MSSVVEELAQHSEDPAVACTVCGAFTCPCESDRCRHQVAFNGGEVEAAYLEFHRPLLAFARRCARKSGLSDADVDCEGVVHDAFLAALPHWGSLTEPRAYLFTVVRILIFKGVRSSSRRWSHALHDAADEVHLWWTSAVLHPPAEKVMATRRLFEVLAGLPERQRVATYLSHVEGMSHAEIAKLLGCAPATVAVHVHRAVEKLRDDTHTVAAPSQRLDLPEPKPQVADLSAWRVWCSRRALRALRRLGRGLVQAVRWSSIQIAVILALLLRRGAAACGVLYPSVAMASLYSTQQLVGTSVSGGSSRRLMGRLLRAQAVRLAPLWFTRIPSAPPCDTCAAGWPRDDGTYGCWCRRYQPAFAPARRLRFRQVLRRRAAHRRTTRNIAFPATPLAAHVLATVAEIPRYQQLPYSIAVAVMLFRMWLARLSLQLRQRRARNGQPPVCSHCGAYRPRDDGSIGCWCGNYRPTVKTFPAKRLLTRKSRS